MKHLKIAYISHGQHETGGYKLEFALCQNLGISEEKRFLRNFRGLQGWILLFAKAFRSANVSGDAIVTVARLIWPVYLRNLCNQKKMILVLHNFDQSDGKPWFYFYLIKKFIEKIKQRKNKLGLVLVSQYWRNEFCEKYGLGENMPNVFVFPNLFDNEKYRFYADIVTKNNRFIHLGQYSEKIDKKAYHLLIHELEKKGFVCYFSSPFEVDHADFPITVFNTHEAYLKQMALSICTVILNSVKEGWNRVAHESFLVGTPVLSMGGGGLEELVDIGGGVNCASVEEVLGIIFSEKYNSINFDALEKYHSKEVSGYIEPIKQWLQA